MPTGPEHDPSSRGVDIALVLADDGDKQFDASPSEVAMGALRLGGWHVKRVVPVPPDFADQDAYLLQVNYELALEPEVPAPRWFEFGVRLSLSGAGRALVLDTVPRNVVEPQAATAYAVGRNLGFVPSSDGGDPEAHMPPVTPFVDVFGVGSSSVRWRHIGTGDGGTRPGSYAAWIIVTVPAGSDEIRVELSARYDLAPNDALGYRPASRPAHLALQLERAPVAAPEPTASAPDGADGPVHGGRRVFVSYAHDDERHASQVLDFSEFLVRCGIDVHMDRWDLHFRRDWYQWAVEQVKLADFVLVVASPMCRKVGDGEIENEKHRGLQSEMSLLREYLHSDREAWIRKLLPVVLPGRSVTEIPRFLQPQTADHYLVADLTAAGAGDLLRALTDQPPFMRPVLGAQITLPPLR